MGIISHFFMALSLAVSLASPIPAVAAVGTSFGGKIITWEPCIAPPGAFFITILPAGTFPIFYIWAPGTLGLPPMHIGQQILGVADIPFACKTLLGPRAGQRMQINGVSI